MGDKIIFVGDAHIKAQMYSSRPGIQGDAYRAIDRLRARALGKGVLAVVFCGDVFDSRVPGPADVACLRDFVEAVSTPVQVMAIQGNHDLRVGGHSWCREVCRCEMPDAIKVGKADLVIQGLDHIPGTEFFDALESTQPCDILVAHQSWTHLDPFDSAPVGPEDIPGCVKHSMVMGHIHVRDARLEARGRWMVSPGGLWATSVDKERGGWCELDLATMKYAFVVDKGARAVHRFDGALGALAFARELPPTEPDDRPIVDVMVREGESEQVKELASLAGRCHLITRAAPMEGAVEVNPAALAAMDRGAVVRSLAGGDQVAVADVTAALEDFSGAALEARLDEVRAARVEARAKVAA